MQPLESQQTSPVNKRSEASSLGKKLNNFFDQLDNNVLEAGRASYALKKFRYGTKLNRLCLQNDRKPNRSTELAQQVKPGAKYLVRMSENFKEGEAPLHNNQP